MNEDKQLVEVNKNNKALAVRKCKELCEVASDFIEDKVDDAKDFFEEVFEFFFHPNDFYDGYGETSYSVRESEYSNPPMHARMFFITAFTIAFTIAFIPLYNILFEGASFDKYRALLTGDLKAFLVVAFLIFLVEAKYVVMENSKVLLLDIADILLLTTFLVAISPILYLTTIIGKYMSYREEALSGGYSY